MVDAIGNQLILDLVKRAQRRPRVAGTPIRKNASAPRSPAAEALGAILRAAGNDGPPIRFEVDGVGIVTLNADRGFVDAVKALGWTALDPLPNDVVQKLASMAKLAPAGRRRPFSTL